MTFSNHFKLSLRLVIVALLLLVGIYAYFNHRIHNTIVPHQMMLPKSDKELISYDSNSHIMTVTTNKGTTSQYSRDSKVEIRKDGTVKIYANKWGTELHPFLGAGYSDTGRAYIGCQLFYFHQLDAAVSFGWTADNRKVAFQPMLSIGYNVWSNTSMNIGVNPVSFLGVGKPEIAAFLSVRL